MSSDGSDPEDQGSVGKPQRNHSDSEEDVNNSYIGKKGPQTPGSPESLRSRSRSRSLSHSRSLRSPTPRSPRSPRTPSRSASRSPGDSQSSPAPIRGPRSPPPIDDDDGRSNISSGSSILSRESGKEEITNGREEPEKQRSPKNRFQVPNAEDLSDVSDIDDSDGLADDDKSRADEESKVEDVRDSVDNRVTKDRELVRESLDYRRVKEQERSDREKRSNLNMDDGEQLDFEAEDQPETLEKEDGECEPAPTGEKEKKEKSEDGEKSGDDGEVGEDGAESLEEGEVTDEGDPKPEKPPICRFYSRGACTWGANCRFLHPGVTDKGNYSMFEVTRPMVASANGMGFYPPDHRPYPMTVPTSRAASYTSTRREETSAAVESAWERGLRQAKEMMRKSTKRKETDMDFEEKKMNLSIGQDEMDKENDYYARAASPVDDPETWSSRYSPKIDPELRRPAVRVVERYEDIIPEALSPDVYDRYEYRRGYDRLRDPEYVLRREKKYYDEEELLARKAEKKMVREVIVQRAERAKRIAAEAGRRPDEWLDPWMRSKSPGRKGHRTRKVSYSSGSSSYSGSSSRSSSNSSYSSYSRSHSRSRSRSRSGSMSGSRSPSRSRRLRPSPTTLPARSKLLPSKDSKIRQGLEKPAGDRPLMMNPPAPTPRRPKERALSPSVMRKVGLNPPAPTPKSRTAIKHGEVRGKPRGRKSRSSSESGSSSSGSESSRSSYSSSSSSSRDGSPPSRPTKKIEPEEMLTTANLKGRSIDALKVAGQKPQIKLTLKPTDGKREKPALPLLTAGKKRPAEEPLTVESPGSSALKSAGAKKASSRREELLKQLKAVEDAIAKKRSKI